MCHWDWKSKSLLKCYLVHINMVNHMMNLRRCPCAWTSFSDIIWNIASPNINLNIFSSRLFFKCVGPCGGQSPASHRGGPGSISGQSMWDLWWTKCHWDKLFSEYFGFPLSISFHRCSIKIEKQKNPSSSSEGCTISLQGCGASVASAAGPFNKKVCYLTTLSLAKTIQRRWQMSELVRSIGGMTLTRKTEVIGDKPVQVPHCPP